MKRAGIFILAIGLLLILFTSFNFITKEKVLDVGALEITQNKNHRLAWSPISGIVLIVVGAGIYMFGVRGK
jgi:hypothetical protein